ncbi:carboxylate-amine ligase [Nocardioides sp. T2.26MG-1]|uniref:carboxylate-amine ligase n=1 Tax=Nocardioides sp. T2.26MG-1 TaxID=3041166 RepID=UPI0024773890|nr:glutamate--cysteine ligase [Nocardioides sp. T2.26MG-1]CAI9414316.1 Putative glutamate--cysteine ligase 2 [Nocardioides sp. T2.26MG-1]
MSTRRFGIEEELLLVDACGAPAARASDLLARCAAADDLLPGTVVAQEFFQAQVEVVTPPLRNLADAEDHLRAGRRALARAGTEVGVAPLAVATPILAEPPGPLVAEDRFARIAKHYAGLGAESLICALQVHVEVASREEGIAVLDRVRPWLPLLTAVSANSPFWHGRDTGFASWRSQLWQLWPSSGPHEVFGDVAAYDALIARLLRDQAILDVGLLNLQVRLSARYPTVEFRVADVCTSLDDTLLQAALARALTETAARQARDGVGPAPWRADSLRSAAWRAGRFGVQDTLVDPGSGDLVPAATALRAMLDHLRDALGDAGDLERVTTSLERITREGCGADHQRRAVTGSDLTAVVDDLRSRTVAG